MNDIRKSIEYKQWKDKVKDRDGNACRKCRHDDNLHIHHIKPFKKYPDFALVLDNGLTLCGNCHSLLKGKEETKNLRGFLGNGSDIDRQLRAIEGSFFKCLDRKLKSANEIERNGAVSELLSHLKVYPNSLFQALPLLVYVVDSENWLDELYPKREVVKWLKKGSKKKKSTKTSSTTETAERIKDRIHLVCPNRVCQQMLRIPEIANRLRITCPTCKTTFEHKVGQTSVTYATTENLVAIQAVSRYEWRLEQKRIEEERIKREEQLRREAEQRAAREKREQEIISEYGSLEAYELRRKRVASLKGYAYGFLGFVIFFGTVLFLILGLLSSC